VAHCATSDDAVLFQVTDREILRRLELLREG
jgi:gentisate 1,2-dioxygenase